MKISIKLFLLTALLSFSSQNTFAYDIAVENSDGKTIYYNYFYGGSELEVTSGKIYYGSVVIPEEVTYQGKTRKVTSIGKGAFGNCHDLTSVTIPNSVTSIGNRAFDFCNGLTSITIPNSVTSIGEYAFNGCRSLTSFTIPNSVTSIGGYAFYDCYGLTSITISNNLTIIGSATFYNCHALTSVIIPNSVTSIGWKAFEKCSALTSVTIPFSVTSIGEYAFQGCTNLTSIITEIKNPLDIKSNTFSNITFSNATLYVPQGSKDDYLSTAVWKNFRFIEEMQETIIPDDPHTEKCEKPVISYQDARLFFKSATEGATCQYTITDTDIKSGTGNEVQLTVMYHVSAFAQKPGWEDSDVAEGTLCWIEIDPKKEGISDLSTSAKAAMQAMAVLIQANDGEVSIEGLPEGTEVSICDVSGMQQGMAMSRDGRAKISTCMKADQVAVVKMGNRAVKVLMK